MAKFRKKPVVIDAVQFDGANLQAATKIEEFVGKKLQWEYWLKEGEMSCIIPTLEGEMTASVGDWIIKGVKGEFYPCKPDIFEVTYEPAEPQKEENHE